MEKLEFERLYRYLPLQKVFRFFDDVPDIDDIFKKHDVVTTSWCCGCNIAASYGMYHRVADLQDVFDVIKEIQPSWVGSFVGSLRKNQMHPCNMFIMKSDDFNDYCSSVFGVIKEFCRKRGWNCDEDIKKYVNLHQREYVKSFYPNNVIDYQARVLGFILERLTSFYIDMRFKKQYIVKMVVTEEKYKTPSDIYEL